MKNLAIIPARSGSKGLKDKNIKLLKHKPLIAYSIESAKKTNIFDEIMLSTDSKVYAKIGEKFGAKVPFFRSSELSSDEATSWDVVKDVLNNYQKLGLVFDTVTLLQPTSPLRTSEDILEGFKVFNEKKANLVVSVCELDHSPLLSNTLPSDHSMVNFLKQKSTSVRRQDFPTYFRINGAIYIVSVDHLMKSSNVFSLNSFALIMNKEHSVDIDDEADFNYAEFLIKSRDKLGSKR
jgi:CMP-N,N'-diacetyllegionaminic acid synthase